MRVPDDHPLALTLALRNPETALAAVQAIHRRMQFSETELTGLAELVVSDTNAKVAVAALEAIERHDDELVLLTMRAALFSAFGPVRQVAIRSWQGGRGTSPPTRSSPSARSDLPHEGGGGVRLPSSQQRNDQPANTSPLVGEVAPSAQHSERVGGTELPPAVFHLLLTDPVWGNRRAALQTIAESADRWQALAAADDPHWRVRHALIRVLLKWDADRDEIRARLQTHPARRAQALLAFLEYRWTDTEPADVSAFALPDPAIRCPFWDWDPAVLAAKLNRMTASERKANIDAMPFLIGHDDDRVWKPAVKAIRDFGEPRHYREAFEWRADPRYGAEPALERLLDGLEEELREESVSVSGPPLPPSRFGTVSEGEGLGVRAEMSRLPSLARAANLTPEDAARIVADPTTETSWEVIAAACRLAKVPLWEVEPKSPSPLGERGRGGGESGQEAGGINRWLVLEESPSPLTPLPRGRGGQIPLGPDGLLVSRLGISGHYLLPPAGFVTAAEAGVNWFFWEPNYTTLTDFSRRMSDADRRRFHFVAGTFEAEGKRVRTDVERALRTLKVEQLGLFLIFWVQSWDRMTDDLRDTVAKLKAEGKVQSVGFSSHNRLLLVRAMQEGWNPVMARHSAAHRGAETAVFPFVPPGTSLITFNNLCYGRLLQPVAGMATPAPADCYRYTLGFPQVSACWSAPSTMEQLQENLAVLRDPRLSDEKREYLQRFGAALYRDEKVFEKLVRMT